jgi:hypothetical protein
MLNSLLVPVLVANIAVFYYLNASRIKNYAFAVRRERQIKAFRIAGLLLVLVAVAQGQNTNCAGPCKNTKSKNTNMSYETPFVAGVIRDVDWDIAEAQARAHGIKLTEAWAWNAQAGVQHSNGNDALFYTVQPEDQDWTNYFWTPATSREHPKLAKALTYTWSHAGALAILGILIFLVLQFSGAGEHDATDINYLHDSQERIMDGDYHGDDAFEVPDGMHSTYESVPVRSRSAAAGR